jgi:hypothetical protein
MDLIAWAIYLSPLKTGRVTLIRGRGLIFDPNAGKQL